MDLRTETEMAYIGAALVSTAGEVENNTLDFDGFQGKLGGVPLGKLAAFIHQLARDGVDPQIVRVMQGLQVLAEPWAQSVKFNLLTQCTETYNNMGGFLEDHARTINKSARDSRVFEVSRQIADLSLKGMDYSAAVKQLNLIYEGGVVGSSGGVMVGDAYRDYLKALEAGEPPPSRVKTGIKDIDDHLYMFEGSLTVGGARTSVGKSVIALQTAYANASAGIPTAIYSVEMNEREVMLRLVTMLTGIPLILLRTMQVDMLTLSQKRVFERVNALPIYVKKTTDAGFVMEDARNKVVRHGYKSIIVDYLQAMRLGGLGLKERTDKQRYEALGEFSGMLKELADREKYKCHVMALAQLSRGSVADGIPGLQHLRESGNLEQDADDVFLMYRDKERNTITLPNGQHDDANQPRQLRPINFIVAKQRNGAVSPDDQHIRLWFEGHNMRFSGQAAGGDDVSGF